MNLIPSINNGASDHHCQSSGSGFTKSTIISPSPLALSNVPIFSYAKKKYSLGCWDKEAQEIIRSS
jgi:hypothetical protein